MKNIREKFFFQKQHNSVKRNYLNRMINNKVKNSLIAKKYNKLYWDGKRDYGYGGYRYIDGYWKNFAKKLIKTYKLNSKSKIIDLGCGKGFLLYEIQKLIPKIKIYGIDISKYAIKNAPKSIKKYLLNKKIENNFTNHLKNKKFDLVISMGCLHNLKIYDLKKAFQNINKISKKSYILVESFRNQTELFNLQCWALTCESFFSKKEWIYLFDSFDYKGDYEFIYFR